MSVEEYAAVDCRAVEALMARKFAAWIGARYFIADIRYESQAVTVKITLRDKDGQFVYPVEGRIMTTAQDLGAQEGAELLIDFIDSYFEEYLKSGGETFLPIDWSAYDFDGRELQVRGQIVNEHLEKLADEFLERAGAVHHQ